MAPTLSFGRVDCLLEKFGAEHLVVRGTYLFNTNKLLAIFWGCEYALMFESPTPYANKDLSTIIVESTGNQPQMYMHLPIILMP
jgi:hypothetical protein